MNDVVEDDKAGYEVDDMSFYELEVGQYFQFDGEEIIYKKVHYMRYRNVERGGIVEVSDPCLVPSVTLLESGPGGLWDD